MRQLFLPFVAALLLGQSLAAQAVPMAGLLAWYPFEGNCLDASGNGRNGTPYTISYTAGHSGQAAWFNGDNSFIGPNINLPAGDWTMCGWAWVDEINPAFTDWQDFLSSWTQGFTVGIDNIAGGKLSIWAGGLAVQDPNPLPLHTPFFWLFERQGDTGSIYRNGQLVAQGTCTLTPSNLRTMGQWRSGAASSFEREPFDGWLDEVCVYNRALSSEEKAELLGGGTVEARETPAAFGLLRAWPNPFNPSTEVRFSLDEPADVRVRILDLQGREVAVLHEGRLSRGEQHLRFQADGLASGLYLCDVAAEGRHQTIKLTLLR